MKNIKDIFDLHDLSDMPREIRLGVSSNRRADTFAIKIIELFDKANRNLTVDEVTVGYYRFYKEKKSRKQIMYKICYLVKADRPFIVCVQKGAKGRKSLYRIKEKSNV